MGTVEDAYGNAMAESFFASLECELINRRYWESQAEARTPFSRQGYPSAFKVEAMQRSWSR